MCNEKTWMNRIKNTNNPTLKNLPQSDRLELPFLDLMQKYHGEIERQLYAAEISCTFRIGERCNMKVPHTTHEWCVFRKDGMICSLEELRHVVGDHFVQHDIMEK